MRVVKHLVGAVVVLLSVVGLVAALAAVVAVWVVRQKLDESSAKVLDRVENALDLTAKTTRRANEVLDRAEASLVEYRKSPPEQADVDASRRLALGMAAGKIRQDYSSQMDEVRYNLSTLAEAAVVANSVLESAEGWAAESGANLDADRARALSDNLGNAAALSRELQGRLKDSPTGGVSPEARQRASEIEAVLQKVRGYTQEFESRVAGLQAREAAVRPRLFFWLYGGALIATALLLWFAVAQVSLLVHGWSWLWGRAARQAGAAPPAPRAV